MKNDVFGNHVGKTNTLISKFRASQTEKQAITKHILLNVSRSKGNQTMNFGELIEFSMRNTFLQKSWRK